MRKKHTLPCATTDSRSHRHKSQMQVAHGLVLDVWIEAIANEDISFASILTHFEDKSIKHMSKNPMRTAKAKEIWEQKRQFVYQFYEEYKKDIQMV